MEHRHFLKLAFGVAAGIAALLPSRKLRRIMVFALQSLVPPRAESAVPAVVAQDEVDRQDAMPVAITDTGTGTGTGITGTTTTGIIIIGGTTIGNLFDIVAIGRAGGS